MSTGERALEFAIPHVGEQYVLGARVPKDDPLWRGPWDCAEFITWCIFQAYGKLFGCLNNSSSPSVANAWTGSWKRDADSGICKTISIAEAARTPGAIVLRAPGQESQPGHIVFASGDGGTIEAMSAKKGVSAGNLRNRRWDMALLIPEVAYRMGPAEIELQPPPTVYRLMAPMMTGDKVREIQLRLMQRGFPSGTVDGVFGSKTQGAVVGFQIAEGLTPDGEVGPDTAAALGMTLE